MHIELVFAVNHGIGDELALAGPIISAFIMNGANISIWTFHPALYFDQRLTVSNWHETPTHEFKPPYCDFGFYLVAENSGLPLQFDRSSLVNKPCASAGWIRLDSDGLYDDPYIYAKQLLRKINYPTPNPPWEFFSSIASNHILLNLVGKGDLCKGLPHDLAWEVIYKVTDNLPHFSFLVIQLNDQGYPIKTNTLKNNLKIKSFPFGSSEVTKLYCNSHLIITAEGGGYHLAYGNNIPALLVTSKQWFDVVSKYALPPLIHEKILFDQINPNVLDIANNISSWIELGQIS